MKPNNHPQFHGMRCLVIVSMFLTMIPAWADAAITLSVNAGWNLLSSTISIQATDVFGDNQKFTSVWKWTDGGTGTKTWAVYFPGDDGGVSYAQSKGFMTLTSIASGEGFWVNSKSDQQVLVSGPPVYGELSFATGWNLVGVKGEQELAVAGLGDVTSVWKWTTVNGIKTWAVCLPGQSTQGDYAAAKGFGQFTTIQPHEGFWVNVPAAAATTTTSTTTPPTTTSTSSTTTTTTTTLPTSWPNLFTPDVTQVGPPDSITVLHTDADGSYPVTWVASATDGVTYVLEEATNSTFTSGKRQAYSGTALNTMIYGRTKGMTYYYRVCAKKSGCTDSAWKTGAHGCFVVSIWATNSVYEIFYKSSLILPAADPAGFAFDNNGNLWILESSYSTIYYSMGPTLYCIDLNSGNIVKEYTYEGIIDEPGSGSYGIAWDDYSIWISISGNTNKLVQIDVNTGQILKTLSSPAWLGPSDLSWDGMNLWLSTGTGEVYKITAGSGLTGVTQFLTLINHRDQGIAYKDGEIWLGNLFDNNLTVYDVNTGKTICTINDKLIHGGMLTFFHDDLAVLSNGMIDLYEVVKLAK